MRFPSVILALALWGLSFQIAAQPFQDPYRYPEDSYLSGGLGITWIDGQPHTTLTIAPDLAFGKFGVGIYLQFLFDNNNELKFRKDEYEDGPGILRAIRYLRYGQKYDPYFFRIGSIERATLANGFLLWNYNNGSSYDKRKIGLIADIDLVQFGLESMASSVGTSNLQGVNFYIRPLQFVTEPPPVLDKLRMYVSYIRDNKVNDQPLNDSTFTTESLSAYSFGVELPWLEFPLVRSAVYADYSSFNDYGSGQAVGINFIFPEFVGLFGLSARLEKRFLGEQFVPNLFGPLYELQRKLGGSQGVLARLENAPSTEGLFGELAGHIVNRIRLIGSYQRLNGIENSGVLHLEASAPNLIPRFELRGYYDKTNIETFDDVGTLDINSVVTAEVGYRLNSFLVLNTIYRWYWVEDENRPGVYKPVERIEPRLSLSYRF